jgi:site-specific recombinase XerD
MGWVRPGRDSGRHKAVQRAAAQAGLAQKGGGPTRRPSVATQRLEHGVPSRGRQARRGHAEVKTPARYTPGMARDIRP